MTPPLKLLWAQPDWYNGRLLLCASLVEANLPQGRDYAGQGSNDSDDGPLVGSRPSAMMADEEPCQSRREQARRKGTHCGRGSIDAGGSNAIHNANDRNNAGYRTRRLSGFSARSTGMGRGQGATEMRGRAISPACRVPSRTPWHGASSAGGVLRFMQIDHQTTVAPLGVDE